MTLGRRTTRFSDLEVTDVVGFTGGIELGPGLVFDTDAPWESGIYWNAGPAAGANVGFGFGFGGGAVLRDIEGWGSDLDLNLGAASPVFLFDDQGFNGFAYGKGPGVGGSVADTYTQTLSVGDVANWLVGDWSWE
jgi:hypothetical protein